MSTLCRFCQVLSHFLAHITLLRIPLIWVVIYQVNENTKRHHRQISEVRTQRGCSLALLLTDAQAVTHLSLVQLKVYPSSLDFSQQVGARLQDKNGSQRPQTAACDGTVRYDLHTDPGDSEIVGWWYSKFGRLAAQYFSTCVQWCLCSISFLSHSMFL